MSLRNDVEKEGAMINELTPPSSIPTNSVHLSSSTTSINRTQIKSPPQPRKMAPRAASPYRSGNPDVDEQEPPRGRKRRRSSAGLQLASKQMSTLRGRARHRSLSILERSAIQDQSDTENETGDLEPEEEIDDATFKMAGIAAGVAVLAAVHKRTARKPARRAAMLPHMKKIADGLVALANSKDQSDSEPDSDPNSDSDSDVEPTESPSTKTPSQSTKKGKHQPATSHPFQYPLSSASGNENPVKIKKKRRSQSPSRSRSREEKGTPRPRRRQRTQSRSRRHE